MNVPPARGNGRNAAIVRQPCSEACLHFRPLRTDRWSEFGLCLNRRSPRCGYPVRLDRECPSYQPTPAAILNRAN